jgi:putative Ca2+/H+ antiporter (TMEM165/GDT1 family)
MDIKILATVFATIFIAELGDKTQLATLLFAADKDTSKVAVFVGASLALIMASAIGVLAGGTISQYVSQKHLQYIAGLGFMVIGIWTLLKAQQRNCGTRLL